MSLFNNPPGAVRLIVAFVILFLLGLFGFNRCAHAVEPFAQVSAGSTYVRGPAPVLDLAMTWKVAPESRNFWKADLTLIGSSTFRGEAAPNNVALRGLYVGGFDRLDVGLGVAWLQNPKPYNGCPMNFTLEIAYRLRALPLTLTASHISSAGTCAPNLGRDFLTLGYRFKP
jgi:Lipid A 3-O-deacylase (PagL)